MVYTGSEHYTRIIVPTNGANVPRFRADIHNKETGDRAVVMYAESYTVIVKASYQALVALEDIERENAEKKKINDNQLSLPF